MAAVDGIGKLGCLLGQLSLLYPSACGWVFVPDWPDPPGIRHVAVHSAVVGTKSHVGCRS